MFKTKWPEPRSPDEYLSDLVRGYKAMFDNLTATQERCTELLEEVRTLRAANAKLRENLQSSTKMIERGTQALEEVRQLHAVNAELRKMLKAAEEADDYIFSGTRNSEDWGGPK